MGLHPKRISFITIHPEFIQSYLQFGVFASALKLGVNFDVVNLRDYAIDKHGSVDDRAYGGGDGMILRPEPLANALKSIKSDEETLVYYPSPHGQVWSHALAVSSLKSVKSHFVFICGRFGGVDQRIIDLFVDVEVSLGDFVISGGELSSLTVADSILRLVPGVLGHNESAQKDSFASDNEGRLEHPQYTRPKEFQGQSVPDILLSGDHKKIDRWKLEQSRLITKDKRPDLLIDQ